MMEGTVRFDEKCIWRMIHVGFLSCIAALGVGSLFGVPAVGWLHLLAAAGALIALAGWDHAGVRGRAALVLGGAALSGGIGVVAGPRDCLLFLRSYGHWLAGSPSWRQEQVIGYEMVQMGLLVLLCYLAQLLMERWFRLRLLAAAALQAALVCALFMEKEVAKPCVALIMCYTALVCVEWNQLRWKKEKCGSMQAYMLWIMPFLAVYLALLSVPAAPEEPYRWELVRNAYERVSESLTKLSQHIAGVGNEDYDLSLSGFSDSGELGGHLVENEREIMRLYGDKGLVTNLYLSGKVYDTFDGGQWTQRNEDSAMERYVDTAETMYALRRYDGKHFRDYLRHANFGIEYRFFRSEYLFAPLKPLSFTQDGRRVEFHEEGGSLCFQRAQGYGTVYETSLYRLNVGTDAFDRFLAEAGDLEPQEQILKELLKELEMRTGERVEPDELAGYRQRVYEHYTEQIAVSKETERYLEEVLSGARSDVEKLRALETELNGFRYSQTPGKLPDAVTDSGTFLDYFLMEGREGYCSHYATAFTLLARKLGLPARYVQGFLIPLKGQEETLVYSDMAHSWPEVYLDGIGWIPFEPTPGYTELRYTPWQAQGEKEPAGGVGQDRYGGGQEEDVQTEDSQLQAAQEDITAQEEDGFVSVWDVRMLPGIIGTALLWIVGALILTLICGRGIDVWRYRRMDAEGQLRTQVYRSLRILSLIGLRRGNETLEEFRQRALSELPAGEPLGFLEDYESVLYGGREAGPHMLAEVKRQQKELLRLLKDRKKWAYLYYRISMAGLG